jgi:hypothetical protein
MVDAHLKNIRDFILIFAPQAKVELLQAYG